MVEGDVAMEDTKNHDPGSGNNIEESYGKILDAKIETEGENLPSAVTYAGNANKNKNGDQCLNELEKETKDKITAESEMEDQANPQRETNQPINVEGSVDEQMDTISNDEERRSTKNNMEAQTANEQAETKNEAVELHTTNGGVKEENSLENGVEGGNPVENVMEENPSGDFTVEKHTGSGSEDGCNVEHAVREEVTNQNAETGSDLKDKQFLSDVASNEAPQGQDAALDEVQQGGEEEMGDATNVNEEKAVNDERKERGKEILLASPVTDANVKTVETAMEHEDDHSSLPTKHEAATPSSLVRYLPEKAGDHSGETVKSVFTQAALPLVGEGDDGTPEDQVAFTKELESFYRERAMDFKPPKFYGQPLNCLKLWRAVIRLGGYDRVTGSKLWRQVGESFHPPKTCTTVSWTFRIFYEKSLLEFERHKTQSGELQLPVAAFLEASVADPEGNGYQGSGSGRARRDAAARAMQGWHVQCLFSHGEVGEPVIKDKNINNMAKREKNVKSIGSLKQKRPNEVEQSSKVARVETSKQLVTTVVDVGPPADWVKINVRQTKDCFEVYALVPGLLREEVRVQSDPAGRLVITGQPEQVDNPWGITPFKKVISLPARIDPLQTSAVVSLHGRLFVRVPFELSTA